MKSETRNTLAWLTLLFAVIIIFFISGCAMFDEKFNEARGLMGIGNDPVIIETPVCEEKCAEEIRG